MITPSEQRLIDLETRLAHHERMVEEMSDVVAGQAAAIEMLTTQLRLVRERVAELESGWSRSPQDDRPPPHY